MRLFCPIWSLCVGLRTPHGDACMPVCIRMTHDDIPHGICTPPRLPCLQGAPLTAIKLWAAWKERHSAADLGRGAAGGSTVGWGVVWCGVVRRTGEWWGLQWGPRLRVLIGAYLRGGASALITARQCPNTTSTLVLSMNKNTVCCPPPISCTHTHTHLSTFPAWLLVACADAGDMRVGEQLLRLLGPLLLAVGVQARQAPSSSRHNSTLCPSVCGSRPRGS